MGLSKMDKVVCALGSKLMAPLTVSFRSTANHSRRLPSPILFKSEQLQVGRINATVIEANMIDCQILWHYAVR
jgi:hypothetical protein